MLSEMLSRIASEYGEERKKPFTGSEFANFITHDLATEAKKQISLWPFDLRLKSSAGNSQWAAVPWLAFFDPLITTSAQHGFYVVYLINPYSKKIFLSFNQGTTAIYNEYKEKRGREVLKNRALEIRARLPEYTRMFSEHPIELGSDTRLPAGYTAGHAFGRSYDAYSVSDVQLLDDLKNMLDAYQLLISRGGTTPSEVLTEEAETTDIIEARRYSVSRRIERAPGVRGKVLRLRGDTCEGCGMKPKADYRYRGPLDNTPLDVHHAKPIKELKEGEEKLYRIPEDFLVLCPNCHRMIHKQDDPSDLERLKRQISFKFSREVLY